MEILDEEIKALLKDLPKAPSGGCPDSEELAGYLENRLDAAAARKISTHTLTCERCKIALCAAGSETPDRVRVPVAARKKAGELVPLKTSPWEIAVRFVSGAIEVLKNTGDETRYFSPAYAGARGAAAAKGTLVAFTRKFAGLEVEVEIEKVSDDVSEIKTTAKNEADGSAAKGVRANLSRDGEEIMSYALAGGYAIFEKIKNGTYKMDFTRRGVAIGEVRIEIKGERP